MTGSGVFVSEIEAIWNAWDVFRLGFVPSTPGGCSRSSYGVSSSSNLPNQLQSVRSTARSEVGGDD